MEKRCQRLTKAFNVHIEDFFLMVCYFSLFKAYPFMANLRLAKYNKLLDYSSQVLPLKFNAVPKYYCYCAICLVM